MARVKGAHRNTFLLVEHGTIQQLRRRPFRKPVLIQEIDLAEVRQLSWAISAFSQAETVRVGFWDRPTDFELALDPMPDDRKAVKIGELRVPDIFASPEAYLDIFETLSPRILSGEVQADVNLATLEPLRAYKMFPGLVTVGSDIRYDPKLAEIQKAQRAAENANTDGSKSSGATGA